MKSKLGLMKEELANMEASFCCKKNSLVQCESSLEIIQANIRALELELQENLHSELSASEQAEVESLSCDIKRLRKEKKEVFAAMMDLEAKKNELENLLTNNLLKHKDKLLNVLRDISLEDRKRMLENCKAELQVISNRFEKVEEMLAAADEKVNNTKLKVRCDFNLYCNRNLESIDFSFDKCKKISSV